MNLVDSAARDCFFGPPPKPEAGHPDPRHWLKQVLEEVGKHCPGRRQTTRCDQPTASNWIQWGGNCYKATGQALNWAQAKEECVHMGGTMAVPQSESETQFLHQLMPNGSGEYGPRLWINCNDIKIDGKSNSRPKMMK